MSEPTVEEEKAEWWHDMVTGLTALVDSHYLLPHNVSDSDRLRQVQTELHDMGAEWDTEWRSENQRLHEQIEALTPLVHQMDGLLTLVAYRGTGAVDDDWKHDAIQTAHAARALLAPTQSGSTQ